MNCVHYADLAIWNIGWFGKDSSPIGDPFWDNLNISTHPTLLVLKLRFFKKWFNFNITFFVKIIQAFHIEPFFENNLLFVTVILIITLTFFVSFPLSLSLSEFLCYHVYSICQIISTFTFFVKIFNFFFQMISTFTFFLRISFSLL